ncbi:MAG: UDP-N-acetylmuramoyl-L-alanyl-D-glutamate--2,6-diaminopimelate ligase [Halioglobus sp.]
MMASQATARRSVPLSVLVGGGPEDVQVSGVQLDSRKISAGDLFLAIAGEVHDGRQFMEQAVANGAVAVVADAPLSGFVDELPVPLLEIPELNLEVGTIASRFFDDPTAKMHMVGVTGTNGKTTTSRLIAQLNRALGEDCGVIGTLGSSREDTVAEAGNTTPDAVSLQSQLAHWQDDGVSCVSMEVSSHALVQGRTNGVRFNTAVYTNLSHDHLDYHGSLANYARAKLQLFTGEDLQYAIINADDPYAMQVPSVVASEARVLTYSSTPGAGADIQIESTRYSSDGVRAVITTPWGQGEFFSTLPGEFNLANLAAAIASVVARGRELPEVLQCVASLKPVPGRMQSIPSNANLQVIVDYAHTPDALHQVLKALKPQVQGQLVVVFGCGGDRDPAKRSIMGRAACELADKVIVTSDNPRGEDPEAIVRDIEAGCSGNYLLQVDRAAAIWLAISEAASGDCVVIAGKGHEDYQIIDGQKLHFSDEEQALDALARRGDA